jgi:chromosome segregation ATPase
VKVFQGRFQGDKISYKYIIKKLLIDFIGYHRRAEAHTKMRLQEFEDYKYSMGVQMEELRKKDNTQILEQLRSENGSLRDQVNSLTESMSELTLKYENCNEKKVEAEKELETLKKHTADIIEKEIEFEKTVAKLRDSLVEVDSENSGLKHQLKKTGDNFHSFVEIFDKILIQMTSVRSDIEHYKAEKEKSKDEAVTRMECGEYARELLTPRPDIQTMLDHRCIDHPLLLQLSGKFFWLI